MKELQREGTAPEQIINDFLKEFNLQRKDISYTIVDEGSKGFLSLFGKKQAVVKFHIKDEKETLLKFLKTLLKKMGVDHKSIDHKLSDGYHRIHIKGIDNPGYLIGKEGRMLFSIEHILNRIIESNDEIRNKVTLDIDGYKEKHAEMILKKVSQIVKKIRDRESSITLEPMNAADRKIVHNYLEKDEFVKTMSIGKGDLKRIVIYPISKEPELYPSQNQPNKPNIKTKNNYPAVKHSQNDKIRAKYGPRKNRKKNDNNHGERQRTTD